jgi:hypothetical protein
MDDSVELAPDDIGDFTASERLALARLCRD